MEKIVRLIVTFLLVSALSIDMVFTMAVILYYVESVLILYIDDYW